MKPLENVWRGLVQRRLLPVAILLVAALAAIPFVLKKDQPVAPAPAPAPIAGEDKVTADAATEKPIVSLVADGERTKRRRVLGSRKDPFAPAPAPKRAKSTVTGSGPATTTGTQGATTEGIKQTTMNGGSSAPSGFAPSVSAPSETPALIAPAPEPKPKYELYSLTVRFGSSEGDALPKRNLPRLKALPAAENPVLVYLGLSKDHKTAIFMVDSLVEPQGDGECRPSPSNCETIHLREGETEFFDVKDENGQVTAQYQLDLVKIKRSTTASAAKAAAARTKASRAGRSVVRARQAADGPLRYRYDAKSGTVRKLSPRAYRALTAKTAKVALAFSGGL